MNQKELGELRRRFKPEKSAVGRVYGCYVNSNKEVISYLDESLGLMPLEEAEKYLGLLKKSLSGTPGRNLIDIVFTTEQVMDSDEHRLLSALRDSELKDGEVRSEFYGKIMESLELGDSNYLILLAFDAYDVPFRGGDGERQDDAGDGVFRYILCAICPVKEGKPELGYFPGENEFHNCTAGQVVSAPEAGFLFPAFDNRAANLYNALYYVRKPDELHPELIEALFRAETPMSAGQQREAFEEALAESLEESCSLEVVQAVHGRLRERIEEHRESKDPEPLAITAREVESILADCGVDGERVDAFGRACGERFGGGAMDPANLIDSKKFEVRTGEVTISVDPEYSYLVETRVIDGKTYLLIPAGSGVELNGMAVGLGGAEPAEA